MTNLFELLFRQPPCCRYCGKQIEKEDFRTEPQPRGLPLCGNCNRTHYEADRLMGVRKPNPKRRRKNMRESHV